MDWFAHFHGDPAGYSSTLLMYDFLMPAALEPEMVKVIEDIAAVQHWERVVFISSASMEDIMRGPYPGSAAKLRMELGTDHFDEIYLARDFCGHGSPLIGNTYPNARKIAYGDSMGLVADRRLFSTVSWKTPLHSIVAMGRMTARRALFGTHRRFRFDDAVLSLPLDLSRGELKGVRLSVPSKTHVERHFRLVCTQLEALRAYCAALLHTPAPVRSHLFLFSNLSASGLMSQENEIAMYVDIIRREAGSGDLVCLKVHPRSSLDVLTAVVAQIESKYLIKIVDDPQFARLPIELWSDLIENCKVVAMFSTSALNIKYIYNKDVVLPLNRSLIDKYVYPNKVQYISDICRMIDESIAALEVWDGKSVLWSKY